MKQTENNESFTMSGHAHEPHIVCPKCSHQIPLTESIAAPLLEAERKSFRQQLAAREAEYAKRADDLKRQQEEVARARESVEEQVKQRLQAERSQLVAAEAKKAREAAEAELQAKDAEASELRRALEVNNTKLADAQQAQAEALRKQRELDEKTRELDVTIEKRLRASQVELVAKARQAVVDEMKSQVSQKDAQIESLGRTVEELKRKLEQGSQQTQGEAFELELENLLRTKFPLDLIEPVAKGESGGDIVHTVNGQIGADAGGKSGLVGRPLARAAPSCTCGGRSPTKHVMRRRGGSRGERGTTFGPEEREEVVGRSFFLAEREAICPRFAPLPPPLNVLPPLS